jgi:predicted chitinase
MLYVCSSKSDIKARAMASRHREEDAVRARFILGAAASSAAFSEHTAGTTSTAFLASVGHGTNSIAVLSGNIKFIICYSYSFRSILHNTWCTYLFMFIASRDQITTTQQ